MRSKASFRSPQKYSKYNDTLKYKPDFEHDVLGDSGHDVLGDSGHDVLSDSAHGILGDLELNVDSDIKFVDNYKGLLNSEENKYSLTNQKKASDTKTILQTLEKYNKTMTISKQIAQHLSLVSNEEFHIQFNVLKHLYESWSMDLRETKRMRMSSETHLPQNDIPKNSIIKQTQSEEIIISRNKKVLGRPKGSRKKQK
ncbi:hypothetical protein SNE40_010219 [Patella caerulea]|uniref:Uncharacterized protein n=1 Tax=Patella caerulea TaxID=87958 RepID=A0AAN8Q4D8_PATCE